MNENKKSNLQYKSNVYISKDEYISNDKKWFSKIEDVEMLNHYNKYKECFTSKQNKILDKARICPDERCWGFKGNKHVCKCIKKDCEYIKLCRGEDKITDEEYERFSPEFNSSEQFEYTGLAINDIHYNIETNKPYNNADNVFFYRFFEDKLEYLYNGIAKNVIRFGIDGKYFNKEIRIEEESYPDEPTEVHYPKKEEQEPIYKNVINNLPDKEILILVHSDEDDNEQEDSDDEEDLADENEFENTENSTDSEKIIESILATGNEFKQVKQKDVYDADISQSFLVNAGPGTGKTYTLIEKIASLINNNDNIEGQDILVLSYTNAAVNEIKSRLRKKVAEGARQTLNNVNVRTSDSFIGYLNNRVYENKVTRTDWDNARIYASNSISTNPKKLRENLPIKYLMIDEVQDITCDLAHFILSLLSYCKKQNIPFALFGDSCQAIFDYESRKKYKSKKINSVIFYNKLKEEFKDYIKNFVELTEYHRQTVELKQYTNELINTFRPALSNINRINKKTIKNYNYNEYFNKKINISDKDALSDILSDSGKKTCFLTRSNAQAFLYASKLRKFDYPVRISLKDDFNQIKLEFSHWISDLFSGYKYPEMDFERFKNRVEKKNIKIPVFVGNDNSLEEFWNHLLFISQEEEEINIKQLLNNIFYYKFKTDDPALIYKNDSFVEVSTIHKAKGREFDVVYIDDNIISNILYKNEKTIQEDFEEYRNLYVAMTRPKNKIGISHCSRINKSIKTHYKTKKYYACEKRKNLKGVPYFHYINYEIGKYVIDFYSFNNDNSQKLLKEVKENDEIILIKQENSDKYDIYIKNEDNDYLPENKLGETNDELCNHFKNLIHIEMPQKISEIYVDGKYAFYDKDDDENEENNKNIWTVISFSGLGMLWV